MKIFAYGSNMCLTRLLSRVQSAKFVSTAKLLNHRLEINKRSKDGSAKANAFETYNIEDFVYGIIFEIDINDKRHLDKAEGLGFGYHEKIINILLTNNEYINAQIYIADKAFIDESLLPYSWYMSYVIIGAKDYKLPEDYIKELENFKTIQDIDPERISDYTTIITLHLQKTTHN